MPAKTSDANRDNIIQKYRSGVPAKNIAAEFGVSDVTVFNILKRAGVETTGQIGKKLPIEEVVRAFGLGAKPRQLAQTYGVSDSVIAAILRKAGIATRSRLESAIVRDLAEAGVTDTDVIQLFSSGIGIRGIYDKLGISVRAVTEILRRNGVDTRDRSQQQTVRMARATTEERVALASAAHEAVRGVARSVEASALGAATSERRGNKRRSAYEDSLAAMLAERGIVTTPQKAFGPYNSDLAADPVAVEVLGGKWHWYGEHLARCEKRTKFILNAGWHVLMIAVTDSSPLTPAVADYVAAYIDEARRNPTAAREYRVIWSAGEFSTAGGADDDNFSIKPPFTSTRDRTTGQYRRAAR